jgi:hypothetical protein
MPSKFSLFAKKTKELEAKSTDQPADSVPAKDKNPDDLEIK